MLNNTKDILTLKDLQELLHIGKNTALHQPQSGVFHICRSYCKSLKVKSTLDLTN